MTKPIALQLYSVRDALAKDFDGTLERVAAIGYAGVETGGFAGGVTDKVAQQLRDLGLTVCGYHAGLPLGGDQPDELFDGLARLNCNRLMVAWLPQELYRTRDGVKQAADKLNAANEIAQARGVRFGYHNHDGEYQQLDGRPAHDYLRELLSPDVFFEVDVYWAQTAGVDPVTAITQLGARAPLLHLKDGPAKRGVPMQALGEGVVDIPACVRAGEAHAEWLIVELDECATDMFEAVEKSYQYLVQNGLGQGQK
jgi:sugar phosphate isomerase/epimerase